MNRKFYYLISAFILALMVVLRSCSQDRDITKVDQERKRNNVSERLVTSTSLYSEKDLKILKFKYNFISINNFDIMSRSSIINNFNKKNFLKVGGFENDDLDFNKANIIDWGNKKSLIIRFKNNYSKFFVVNSLKNSDDFDLNRGLIVETIVTGEKRGKVIISDVNHKVIDLIDNGFVSTTVVYGKKNAFRECLDDAYDAICDGPIGCLAWYTSPLVPATAIAYCTLNT